MDFKYKLPYDKKPSMLDVIMSNKKIMLGVLSSVLAFALGVPWIKNDPTSSVFVMLTEASPLGMAIVGATLGAFIIYAGNKMFKAFFSTDPATKSKARNKDIVLQHLNEITKSNDKITAKLESEITSSKEAIRKFIYENFSDSGIEEQIIYDAINNPRKFINSKGVFTYTNPHNPGEKIPVTDPQFKIHIENYIDSCQAYEAFKRGFNDALNFVDYPKNANPKTIIEDAIMKSSKIDDLKTGAKLSQAVASKLSSVIRNNDTSTRDPRGRGRYRAG